MKISRNWLQTFFDAPIPDAGELAIALTFHAFEIESIEPTMIYHSENQSGDSVLDVKVTANRGHDCLCHRGIAKEISAILDIPMKADPLRSPVSLEPKTTDISVTIEEPSLCPRYIAGYIHDVKVGPSPDWLRNSLEAIGQRSINNIVDATNYVMFTLGQPLHAFDAGKLKAVENKYKVVVRKAREGEKIVTLDNKEYSLTNATPLIVDGNSDVPIGVAGVKGGMPASITESTTDIIIESANFDGASVRKTAQYLKLRTDASARYEQVISSDLAAHGMRAVVDLITQIACPEQGRRAGGEIIGFVDEYPVAAQKTDAQVSTMRINATLGSSYADADVVDVFRRLGFAHVQSGENFVVHVPFERLDIAIPEDLVEEVGRIIGYDKVAATPLPAISRKPEINANFAAAEKKREELLAQGYSEVFTSVFRDTGERSVINKVDSDKPYLRNNLKPALAEAWLRNSMIKDILGLSTVKIFEIGPVWENGEEIIMVGTAEGERIQSSKASESVKTTEEQLVVSDNIEQYDELPLSKTTRYTSFSRYPYIVRDVSMWLPDTDAARSEIIFGTFKQYDDDLIRTIIITDQFKKDDRQSMTFRLVFQSFEKTLTDDEVNLIMQKIYVALKEKGFEIR